MKEQIENYVAEIEMAYKESPFWSGEKGERADTHKFKIEYGRKFAKVIHNSWGSESVHCFVEIANGNIHKAATFRAPQKNGVRGNLTDAKRPIFGGDFYKRGSFTVS